MICGAPNDKLLDDGLSTELYRCELEAEHRGPHMSSGHPRWYDESYYEALADEAEAGYDVEHLKGKPNRPDLATRALKAMLPPDAANVADGLEQAADQFEVIYAKYGSVPFVNYLRRAAAILRGEP